MLKEAQKQILRRYKNLTTIDDLPKRVWDELVTIADDESLYQDADRFLWDQYCAGHPDMFVRMPW